MRITDIRSLLCDGPRTLHSGLMSVAAGLHLTRN